MVKKYVMNSKIKPLDNCNCVVINSPANCIYPNPYSYVISSRFWCSAYKFHYKYEHTEKYVTKFFFNKFVIASIDIINCFKKQVDYFNYFCDFKVSDPDLISLTLQTCGELIRQTNNYLSDVNIELLFSVFGLLEKILYMWEIFIYRNGIKIIV
jgi:hypothetical protein